MIPDIFQSKGISFMSQTATHTPVFSLTVKPHSPSHWPNPSDFLIHSYNWLAEPNRLEYSEHVPLYIETTRASVVSSINRQHTIIVDTSDPYANLIIESTDNNEFTDMARMLGIDLDNWLIMKNKPTLEDVMHSEINAAKPRTVNIDQRLIDQLIDMAVLMIDERAIIDSLYTTSNDDIPMEVTHSKTATKSVTFEFDIDPNVWMKAVLAQINDKTTRLDMLKIAYSIVHNSNKFPVAA